MFLIIMDSLHIKVCWTYIYNIFISLPELREFSHSVDISDFCTKHFEAANIQSTTLVAFQFYSTLSELQFYKQEHDVL